MKLSHEQLVDWFFTANRGFPAAAKEMWLAMLSLPPEGLKRSEVVSGMKQGINDTLTTAKWKSVDERAKIDAALVAKGLPSLRKMEAVFKMKHKRILARGHIRNDEEFYIVAEILSDQEFEIVDADRCKLGEISYAYETRTPRA